MQHKFRCRRSKAVWWCAAAPWAALAQDAAPPDAATSQVVITATRTEARAFDIPASVSRIGADEVRAGRAQVNISESLGAVPGLLARDRQNYAQDVQISVRGFGARASFGIRGVRLYVDGIPATLPDGQGQISNVDLASVGRIEVLRGPFSALYGNSSGGVIQVFTDEGSGPPQMGFGVLAGSDGASRLGVQASGATGAGTGGLGYVLSASRYSTEGFRDHSATERSLANAKLSLRPDADTRLSLLANSVALPKAQDPLGLTRAQYESNPRGVDSSATDFNTRKTVNQTQLGVTAERRLNSRHALQLLAYSGHRGTEQYQAIPRATQAAALSPGGVIALGRDYAGTDLRWRGRLGDGAAKEADADADADAQAPLTLIAGLAYDTLREERQGFQNFIGTVQGVRGALRRNEINHVSSLDPYLQVAWRIQPQLTLNAGLRHSRVHFDSADKYIVGANPDDSGSATYSASLPVLGLLWAATADVHLYATAGRGFETPTLNELSYRANGATGLNFGLQAARSSSVEAGLKARRAGWGEFTAAAFQTGTSQEIVTQTNSGGRSTFQNAGRTRRNGLELGWSATPVQALRLQVAATLLNATYRDAFLTCTATPCTVPNVPIAAGRRIPGIARGSLFAGLAWLPASGWRGGIDVRYLSPVFVNDANTDAAAHYSVVSAHLGYALQAGPWELNVFVRGDNLLGAHYAGSVIVNEGNGRFFEPAPGRTGLASASLTYRF